MQQDRTLLFEETPIPKAVATLAVPTILSSLVMVLYNLADTYFVGMLGDPIQNAAVTLAAPVLLAFNAVNNLFGVGSSSMMSRALGRRDYDTVGKSSAFGFWCAILSGLAFSLLCIRVRKPPAGPAGRRCRPPGPPPRPICSGPSSAALPRRSSTSSWPIWCVPRVLPCTPASAP